MTNYGGYYFDKKKYFTIVRSGVHSLLATWVHEKQAQKLYPKAPAVVSIDQFEFRLQDEGVVGIGKACHFASSCHAYDMFLSLWEMIVHIFCYEAVQVS